MQRTVFTRLIRRRALVWPYMFHILCVDLRLKSYKIASICFVPQKGMFRPKYKHVEMLRSQCRRGSRVGLELRPRSAVVRGSRLGWEGGACGRAHGVSPSPVDPAQPAPPHICCGLVQRAWGWLALRGGVGFPSSGQAPAVVSACVSWQAGPCSGSRAGFEGAVTPASSHLTAPSFTQPG